MKATGPKKGPERKQRWLYLRSEASIHTNEAPLQAAILLVLDKSPNLIGVIYTYINK